MRLICVVVLLMSSAACKVGSDSLLFATRTSVAIDVDTQPPTFDVGYKRDELVLAPVDEEGKVLPVMTTVGVSAKPLSFGANHSFATGDAALLMSRYLLDDTAPTASASIDPKNPTAFDAEHPEQGNMDGTIDAKGTRRYYFGTNTVFGLGVQWNAEYIPTAVALGYKRKELALIPLAEKDGRRGVASLIATAHAGSQVDNAQNTGAILGQTFATGLAATFLAMHPEVRRAIGPSVVPNYDKARQELDEIKAAQVTADKQAKQRADEHSIVAEIATRYDGGNDTAKLAMMQRASELASLECESPGTTPITRQEFTKRISKNANGTQAAVLADLRTLNAFRP